MKVGGYDVPPANGDPAPSWPLAQPPPYRVTGDFGAPRAGGTRYHVGEDLPAAPGTMVRAPEPGRVVAVHGFTSRPSFSADTHVILLETLSGIVLALAEVEPGSTMPVGAVVERGQDLALVGGLSMIHVEAYVAGVRRTSPWYVGRPPPQGLLDPTDYLRRAAGMAPADAPTPTPPKPPPPDETPPRPAAKAGIGAGLVAAAVFLLASEVA